MGMTETDKLLVRIGTARDAISRKTEQTSLDYMIDGALMNCSVMLKEQEDAINELQNAYEYLQKQFLEVQDKLLKEQEAVKPKCKERMGGFVAGLCPTCGTALNNVLNVKACGKCGQVVKWE